MKHIFSVLFLLFFAVLLATPAAADQPDDCRSGAPPAAISACTDLLTQTPAMAAEWYAYRGGAKLRGGEAGAAIDDLSKAIGLDPVFGLAYALRASAYLDRGDRDAAQADAGFAVVLAPDDYRAHLAQAQVLAATDAEDAARRSFDTALGLAPDDAARRAVGAARDQSLTQVSPPVVAVQQDDVEVADPGAAAKTSVPPAVVAAVPPAGQLAETPDKTVVVPPIGAWPTVPPGELAFWETVKDSADPEELETYIATYPDGHFVDLAKIRLRRLQSAAAKSTTPAILEIPKPIPVSAEDSPLVAACDRAAMHDANTDNPGNIPAVAWDALDPPRILAACRKALDAFPRHERTIFHLARAYHKAGDAGAAENYYRQAAAGNYVRALAGMGVLLNDGLLRDASPLEALPFFQAAAEFGDWISQKELAKIYRFGPDSIKNDFAAARWYRAAADQGDAQSQNDLGWMYEQGLGLPKSDRDATIWYRRAAEQGLMSAQTNLGWMFENGRGVPQSDTEAAIWYRRAAEQGQARAQTNLGYLHEKGRGVPQSDTEAVAWYRRAADQGQAIAQANLGWMYEKGRGVPQSDAEALALYQSAADQGLARAQANLGWMHENGRGVKKDASAGFAWYMRAAEQGDARGQLEVGRMYLYGAGVPKNASEALKWFQKSAKQDYALSFTFLGYLRETEREFYDAQKAARNYSKALASGESFPATRPARDWDRATAKEMQRLLQQDGYYKGRLDGVVGPATIAAMKKLCGC